MVKQAKKKQEPKNVGQDPDKEKTAAQSNLIGQGNRQLKGMLEICKYVGFSESTILHWIRNDSFPATKTTEPGGIWVSTTNRVDKWRDIFFA